MLHKIIRSILIFLISFSCLSALNPTNPKQQILYNKTFYSIEEILSKYIKLKSESGQEELAGSFLKKLCLENGLFVTQMGEENGNYNFSASIRPLDEYRPNIIFLNHIDVVPAGNLNEWTYPPFSGKITDTEIWGRGAFDNKGTAIMQLFSIIDIARRYRNKDIDYNVTMLSVSCEETQCDGGIRYVINNYLDLLNPQVVIGEGPPALTGLIENKPELSLFGISVVQKRTLWLKLSLNIETNGHSSVTPLTYANKEMITALNRVVNRKSRIVYNDVNLGMLKRMGQLNGGFKGFVMKHPKLFKPFIIKKIHEDPLLLALYSDTVTLTNFNDDNDKPNTLSNEVSATLDCRLLPETNTKNFIKKLSRNLKNKNIKITILSEMDRQKVSSTDSFFYQNLNRAIVTEYPGSSTAAVMLPNSNDVAFFRSNNIPAYSVVPVQLTREYLECIHNHNERIPKDILGKGKNTFVRFLEYCINKSESTPHIKHDSNHHKEDVVLTAQKS